MRASIGNTSVLALLCVAAGVDALPAATWPTEGAVEVLIGLLCPTSRLLAAVRRAGFRESHAGDQRISGVKPALEEAMLAGHLRPVGSGWSARYAVNGGWLDRHRALYQQLDQDDQAALHVAGQRLVAMATMVSKKFAA